MSDTLNQQAAGHHAILVQFAWGSHTVCYTSWTDDLVIFGVTYRATSMDLAALTALGLPFAPAQPAIETRVKVEPSKQTGAVSDEPWNVTMPRVAPLTLLDRDAIFTSTLCIISEVDPTELTNPATVLWEGVVTQTIGDPQETPGMIKFEVSGKRVSVQYPLGVESKTTCSRTFGDRWCGVNLSLYQQTTTITAVTANLIVAPGLTIPSGKPSSWWTYGWVTYDYLSISIIDGSGVGAGLKLLQRVPPEWTGVSAVFTPGCAKTLAACDTFNNRARFFGIGLMTPSASPSITPR